VTKKLIFPLLAVLLLLPWPAYAYEIPRQQTASVEVSEPSAVTNVGSAVSGDSVGSTSQAITLKNPTFQELKDFILKDPTNRNKFVPNQYECRNFATEVNNNAEAEGLRCAFVLLCYDLGQHAVVAFDTTDTGLVYIEPQTDAAIHPEVGGKYQGEEIIEILIAW
jgi:hypothetical protein